MKPDVAIDWAWSDGHLDAVAEVLRQNAMHLLVIRPASDRQDLQEATDLVITVIGGDVAVRIRDQNVRKKYRDLTLRAWRASGAKTELEKIKEGFARWYLYGWSDGNFGLADWILVDLDKLRESGLLDNPEIIENKDGHTRFAPFSAERLRIYGCLIAEKDSVKKIPVAIKPIQLSMIL